MAWPLYLQEMMYNQQGFNKRIGLQIPISYFQNFQRKIWKKGYSREIVFVLNLVTFQQVFQEHEELQIL